jgi:hypothetical protein
MKSALFFSVFASVLLVGSNVFAQGTCQNGGGNQPYPGPTGPYAQPSPYGQNGPYGGQPYLNSMPNSGVYPVSGTVGLPSAATQTAPQARITVVESGPQVGSAPVNSAAPAARITVVKETPQDTLKVEVAKAVEETEKINSALEGLVGNWTAVARHGDGELTTVELQLDNRGWAKLTVPGTDGKPSTIERKVELNDKELKLTGGDAELLLGKLVDVNSRQMVLERSGGQVTFVRP